MLYKESKITDDGLFPYSETIIDDFFQRVYDYQEWNNQISLVIKNFDQKNYELYSIYEYILSSNYEIPYQLLVDSQFLEYLLNHFNKLVFDLCGKQINDLINIQDIQNILYNPEKKIEFVDPYLILCVRIFIFLLKTDFLIENSVFNDTFFNSICMLCFNRNKYCRIMEENPNKFYSLCTESLKLVKLLFESSQDILLFFEDKFYFSLHINQQYIMAQVFEIKYHSIAALLPWIPIYPGNLQIFDLYSAEILKTIKNENAYIFKSQTAEMHYNNSADSEYDKEIIKQDNKFNLISLMLYGILKFVKLKPKQETRNNEEEEIEKEEEDKEPSFNPMEYAYQKGVIKLVSFAIKSNHDEIILYGFKIFNFYLEEKRLTEYDIIMLLTDIRTETDKMPVLLNYSDKICKEEIKMLIILLDVMPENDYISFFDVSFISYTLHVLNDKKFKWKIYLYEFIALLLIRMNYNFIENLLNDIDIIEFLSDIGNTSENKVVDLYFEGFHRIMNNSPELKQILIDKGIEEEINEFIEDPEYSEKAQSILYLIQSK